jgi:hypothetical protein
MPNKEQRERLKQHLECIDDLVDPVVDVVELPDNALAFWEAYFWGRVACHLHMRIAKRGQRGTCNLCADFEVFRGMPEVEFEVLSGTWFELESAGGYKYGGCHPVFVSVGEDSENGECVSLGIASSVRLKALDDCPMRGEYVFEGIGFRKLFRDDILDTLVRRLDFYRKSGSPRPAARKFLASGLHEGKLPNEMVEDTAQVVHDITHEQAQVKSWQIGSVNDLEDIVSRLLVELTGESYKVRFIHEEAGADFFVQDVAMFPRPCKFGSTSTEVGAVGHDKYNGGVMASKRSKLP